MKLKCIELTMKLNLMTPNKRFHVYMLLRNNLALCGTIQQTTEQYIALYYRTMRCAKSLVIMSTGMSDKSSICASGVL